MHEPKIFFTTENTREIIEYKIILSATSVFLGGLCVKNFLS